MALWPTHRVADAPTDLWSVPVGAWLGVPVRLHLTLVATLVLAAGAAVQAASFDIGLAIAVFLASVVLHETAHAVAAWRLGGVVEGVVLSPIGGIRSPRTPSQPEARVFVAMAGPMANLSVVVAAVIGLAWWGEPASPTLFLPLLDDSMRPLLDGPTLSAGEPLTALAKIAIWVNWPLFALNLLPAFPFDGGEAGRWLLAPRLGSVTSAEVVGRIALLVGGLLLLFAPVLQGPLGAWPELPALAAVIGVVVCFGSHRDRVLARHGRPTGPGSLTYPTDEGGFDLSDDEWVGDDQVVVMEVGRHAGYEGPKNGPRGDPPIADESTDEQQLDEVLAKLHVNGMDGLTVAERRFLKRASDRFRRRRDD